MLSRSHMRVELLGSEIMQNLLSVTVHLPALQNMVIVNSAVARTPCQGWDVWLYLPEIIKILNFT